MTRFALLLLLVGLFPATVHCQACHDSPHLILQFRAPAPRSVTEHSVSATDIEKLSAAPARHALMAITYALDARIAIVRPPAAAPTAACGSFAIVVTFGVGRRDAFLAREAAAVPCVRRALLAHEDEHSRIIKGGIVISTKLGHPRKPVVV